jgi:hypothetical protein
MASKTLPTKPNTEQLLLIKQTLKICRVQAKVAKNFAEQGPDDDPGTMVGNDYYATGKIAKNIVATLTPDPLKA